MAGDMRGAVPPRPLRTDPTLYKRPCGCSAHGKDGPSELRGNVSVVGALISTVGAIKGGAAGLRQGTGTGQTRTRLCTQKA